MIPNLERGFTAVQFTVTAAAILGGSFVATLAAEPVNPKISLRSLVLLEQKLRGESKTQERAKTCKDILDVGASLVAGAMAPSAASSVADSLKSGRELLEDQKGYVGFWLLRAVAAVEADNERAGVEAVKVLKTARHRELGQAGGNRRDRVTQYERLARYRSEGTPNSRGGSGSQGGEATSSRCSKG